MKKSLQKLDSKQIDSLSQQVSKRSPKINFCESQNMIRVNSISESHIKKIISLYQNENSQKLKPMSNDSNLLWKLQANAKDKSPENHEKSQSECRNQNKSVSYTNETDFSKKFYVSKSVPKDINKSKIDICHKNKVNHLS